MKKYSKIFFIVFLLLGVLTAKAEIPLATPLDNPILICKYEFYFHTPDTCVLVRAGYELYNPYSIQPEEGIGQPSYWSEQADSQDTYYSCLVSIANYQDKLIPDKISRWQSRRFIIRDTILLGRSNLVWNNLQKLLSQAVAILIRKYKLAIVKSIYPNPFNPSTTISFTLPQADFVSLKIYNTLGQKVATLMEKNLPAGEHQVKWHAQDLAGGIYICQFESGGFKQTRKMILIK